MPRMHQPPQGSSAAAAIIVVVLLLLPLLYVGSYFVLVWPDALRYHSQDSRWEVFPKYRYGTQSWAGTVYWPLEQIDRKVRPDEWCNPSPCTTPAERVERVTPEVRECDWRAGRRRSARAAASATA